MDQRRRQRRASDSTTVKPESPERNPSDSLRRRKGKASSNIKIPFHCYEPDLLRPRREIPHVPLGAIPLPKDHPATRTKTLHSIPTNPLLTNHARGDISRLLPFPTSMADWRLCPTFPKTGACECNPAIAQDVRLCPKLSRGEPCQCPGVAELCNYTAPKRPMPAQPIDDMLRSRSLSVGDLVGKYDQYNVVARGKHYGRTAT